MDAPRVQFFHNAVNGLDYVNINDGNVVYAVETTLGDAFDYDLEELVEEVETEDTATNEAKEEEHNTAESSVNTTIE